MKTKLIMIICIFTSLHADETSMAWVDQKIEEIKPQRHGISNSAIKSLKNPFIIIKGNNDGTKVAKTKGPTDKNIIKKPVKKDMSKEPFTLQMVLNSTAYINGKWYKENAIVRGYTLTKIQSDHVVLQYKKRSIKLFIAQKNKNLKISTK